MDLIRIEHLDFAYGEQLVLKHIDLGVERGSTVGVIGPNGGGKTTLMKLLLGLVEPTRGRIEIDGMRPREATRRGTWWGYLPQNPRVPGALPDGRAAGGAAGIGGEDGDAAGVCREDLEFADHLIERVGLGNSRGSRWGSCRGGSCSGCLLRGRWRRGRRCLLLDEPTTGIDAAGQQRFIEFLEQLKEELDLTVVLVAMICGAWGRCRIGSRV